MSLNLRALAALLLCLTLLAAVAVTPAATHAAAQEGAAKKDKKEKKNDGPKNADLDDPTKGTPVLWTERNIESLDLFHGPGGQSNAPNPQDRFRFIERDTGGTSEKFVARDSQNREWVVKLGAESRSETAATRLVWAAGYHADWDYFVPEARIEGRGGFTVYDSRFENKEDGLKTLDIWKWDANPFLGTRELNGLRTLMVLLNNWDLKDVNNKIVRPNKESGGDRMMRIYYVSDLGGTLGKTGNFIQKLPLFGGAAAGTKGIAEDFANQRFIEGVKDGQVVFHYEGKNSAAVRGVPVEHARWMGELLGRLSDKQLSDAFRASGFDDQETATYVRAIRDRINQLKNLR